MEKSFLPRKMLMKRTLSKITALTLLCATIPVCSQEPIPPSPTPLTPPRPIPLTPHSTQQEQKEYQPKDYSHLLGMKGFSKEALVLHFTLYQGYVKNTNLLVR